MHTVQFIKKYKGILNIYSLELSCRVRRNTIAHAIGKEQREIPLAYEEQVYQYLERMEADLSTCLVEYWQRNKAPIIAKELSLKNGADSTRKHTGKRKA